MDGAARVSNITTTAPGGHVLGEWARAIRSIGLLASDHPVKVSRSSDGYRVSYRTTKNAYFRLTSTLGSGLYAGVEVHPTATGTWATTPSGLAVSNLYEANAVTGLVGNVVEAYFETSLGAPEWRFWHNRQGITDPGGIPIPGCLCASTPRVLHLTQNHPDALIPTLYPCTIQWGPTPAGLLPLLLGTNCYLSTVQFVDPYSGDLYWYLVQCFTGFYNLTRVYATSIYGSPYRDVIRYRWLIGSPGNSCHPFLMAVGTIYAGGDPTCVMTLSE